MQTFQPSIFARNDTLLGICQAVGEDLGFNPTWLRVALACGIFFNFAATIGAYLALGAVVLATRLLYRSPRKIASQPVAPAAAVIQTMPTPLLASDAENGDHRVLLAEAA